MSQGSRLEVHLDYFLESPVGESDVLLGNIGAVIAEEACSGEKCNISTTCNPFTNNPDRYLRRARLANCHTCFMQTVVDNTSKVPSNPEIVVIDQGTFLRKEALDALNKFWEVVDTVDDARHVSSYEVRQLIAEAITAQYTTAQLPE